MCLFVKKICLCKSYFIMCLFAILSDLVDSEGVSCERGSLLSDLGYRFNRFVF